MDLPVLSERNRFEEALDGLQLVAVVAVDLGEQGVDAAVPVCGDAIGDFGVLPRRLVSRPRSRGRRRGLRHAFLIARDG